MEKSWSDKLSAEMQKSYFLKLREFVKKEYEQTTCYPPKQNIVKAFDETPFQQVKVVILGQDPYHGAHQANGLSFSVNKGVTLPKSLQNIYKELADDLQVTPPTDGDLSHWANQGVLMLNSILTVRAGQAGSHQNQGWEQFTDKVIETLNKERENVVFILWGKYAQTKAAMIDEQKHYVIKSAHPSPFSAYSGFFGSKPFSKANQYLRTHNIKEINW